MGKNKDNVISKEEFFALQDRNIPYEGYVEGLGYVLPEAVVIGRQRNPHHRMFSIHKNVLYAIVPDAIPNTRKQAEMEIKIQKEQWEYERRRNNAKEAFRRLVGRKLQEAKLIQGQVSLDPNSNKNYRDEVRSYVTIYNKLYHNIDNSRVYKIDVPRDILLEK